MGNRVRGRKHGNRGKNRPIENAEKANTNTTQVDETKRKEFNEKFPDNKHAKLEAEIARRQQKSEGKA